MMYTCETAPASELAAYGSIYKVVSADELMGTARQVAATIAAKAPTVVRKAKRAFNNIDADPMKSYRTEQGFTMELNLSGVSDEARDAFVDKRDAEFDQ